MQENNGTKLNIITFLLIVAIIAIIIMVAIIIMGYSIHKIYNDKEIDNKQAGKIDNQVSNIEQPKDDEKNNTKEEKTNNDYTYSNIQGLYKANTKDKDGENRKYELYLSETGTFIYVNYVDSETGIVGNYTIVDDQIILNYLFSKGNDAELTATEGKKVLKIGENNIITDSKPENTNSSSLELSKEKNSQDDLYYSTNGVNYMINNSNIINKYNSENQ